MDRGWKSWQVALAVSDARLTPKLGHSSVKAQGHAVNSHFLPILGGFHLNGGTPFMDGFFLRDLGVPL